MNHLKRISRSERYKRQIRELTHILQTVAPELPPERQELIKAALSAVTTSKETTNEEANAETPSRP